ncbi:MAG: Na+/H+ antiporter NhaC [Streptosporangiales bacterium]|nr:Na+/H+ antiporter NhaC [Streptosporangiales bacterium]
MALALFTVFTSLAVVLVGGIVLDVGFLVPLLVAATVASIFGLAMGFRWSEIQEGILRTVSQGLVAVMILLLVGILIGVWILGETVPLMLAWGLELLSPTTFLVGAFTLCALFSLATGTSFGTIGSAGLALLGVGQAMDYPLGLTVGAIVGGAYLGDKASPVSDTTNTAAAITGVDLFRHISSLLYVTVPAAVVTLVIYGFMGAAHRGGPAPEQVGVVQDVLEQNFTLSPLSLLPPAILIALAVRRVPAIPTLAISILVGALVALPVRGAGGTEILQVATAGYTSETGNELVDNLLSRGGIESMLETIGLLICALTLGGVLERTGTLRVIIGAVTRRVRRTGTLIISVLVSCYVMLAGTGNTFVSIIVPGRAFLPSFAAHGIQARVLSRTLEDGGTVASPLIPWSLAAFFIAGILEVPATTYAPYVFFGLLCPLFSILFGFTGFAIFRDRQPSPDTTVETLVER